MQEPRTGHRKKWDIALRYYFTIRELRGRQIAARIGRSFYRPRVRSNLLPAKRAALERWVDGPRRRASMITSESFVFLNEYGSVYAYTDWDDPSRSRLWRYNLHYFDDLNAESAVDRIDWHVALIDRWIRQNPAFSGSGWEPYPTSLRTVNWIKWDLETSRLSRQAIGSLALQLRWLRKRIENHLGGNHLLANAKALIFGGLYFEGREARDWLSVGLRILNRELEEQVLQDGGHFELSPMYHLIVLEDLLDVVNVCRAFGYPVPNTWPNAASSMLRWARAMQHPDGAIPFFNDSAFGIAASLQDIDRYARRLAQESPCTGVVDYVTESLAESETNLYLVDSGYARMAGDAAVLFMDLASIGPRYIPGHAHADTLSIELSLYGQRVLVNSGTSVYGDGLERHRQRSTAAHNTVTVNGENSSEVWSGFRVARRATVRVLDFDNARGRIRAEHNGYRRLVGQPIHRREVTILDRALRVEDVVEVSISRPTDLRVDCFWHLHPEVEIVDFASHASQEMGRAFEVLVPVSGGTRSAHLCILGADSVAIEPSTWHPEFGKSISNKRIVASTTGNRACTIITELRWQ